MRGQLPLLSGDGQRSGCSLLSASLSPDVLLVPWKGAGGSRGPDTPSAGAMAGAGTEPRG